MTPPSAGLLLQMVEQNDVKHEAAHRRLRLDLTEGLNEMNGHIDRLDLAQRQDHEEVVLQRGHLERRKELSGYHAVIIAACIGGGFRLVEVLITSVSHLVRP